MDDHLPGPTSGKGLSCDRLHVSSLTAEAQLFKQI